MMREVSSWGISSYCARTLVRQVIIFSEQGVQESDSLKYETLARHDDLFQGQQDFHFLNEVFRVVSPVSALVALVETPDGQTAEFQELGWGRCRDCCFPGPSLLRHLKTLPEHWLSTSRLLVGESLFLLFCLGWGTSW